MKRWLAMAALVLAGCGGNPPVPPAAKVPARDDAGYLEPGTRMMAWHLDRDRILVIPDEGVAPADVPDVPVGTKCTVVRDAEAVTDPPGVRKVRVSFDGPPEWFGTVYRANPRPIP